ncbi:hypothetical protein FBT53_02085 [Flavobacterium sp. ASW18X]|nr:hypothetical protein [Flavobacterium sp. ASW18X]TKD66668.1 hypothetical protein FBT53_02085 [Flavobacterium sp. ASW18X]
MRLVYIKRTTKNERRYNPKMGMFSAKVTYIKRYVLGFPTRTLHKYRETYYGKVKSCEDCVLAH